MADGPLQPGYPGSTGFELGVKPLCQVNQEACGMHSIHAAWQRGRSRRGQPSQGGVRQQLWLMVRQSLGWQWTRIWTVITEIKQCRWISPFPNSCFPSGGRVKPSHSHINCVRN